MAPGGLTHMPYPPEHRKLTKMRILQSAQSLFNRRGFEQVSIAEVMAKAGLTRGGFYSYFKSKTDLYVETVSLGLNTVARLRRLEEASGTAAKAANVEAAQRTVRAYLSRQHFDDLEGSCPLAALPSDVLRSEPVVKQAFESVFRSLVETFERALGDGAQLARDRALAIASLCVGGMVVARSLNDDAFADELRHGAIRAAFQLGSWSSSTKSAPPLAI
jgi:TetR/AcrR family transcriptional regulator, transcriptional repressor for nem operon